MITRWSTGVASENMDESILVDLAGIVERHPWWAARASLTIALLNELDIRPPARVLDAGCGWGVTLKALERRGYQVAGMDVSRHALERLDRPGRTLIEANLSETIDNQTAAFDAVLTLDVIEHVDDDRAVVSGLARLVVPGGVVVLSVPAQPTLFSEFDTIQGHRRRYLPESLTAVFEGTGLILERLFWWGSWLTPILERQRSRPRSVAGESAAETYRRYLQLPPWPLSWALRLPFAWEQPRALRGRLQTGTSLFAVARRPEIAPTLPSTDSSIMKPPLNLNRF